MNFRKTIITKIILATLFASAAPLSSANAEREVGSVSGSVVNGSPATRNELYSTVSVIERSNDPVADDFFCSGTLIRPDVVMTAAHCVTDFGYDEDDEDYDDESTVEIEVVSPSELQVAAGYLGYSDFQSEAQVVDVKEVIVHEGWQWLAQLDEFYELHCDFYVCDAPGMGHVDDIALLVLKKPITVVPAIEILPHEMVQAALPVAKDSTVSGYGINDIDGYDNYEVEAIGELYYATTKVELQTSTEILTLGGVGLGLGDACNGDSGGPLYVEHNGTLYVAGVTSRGRLDSEDACGPGSIYTLASSYTAWIDANLSGSGTGEEAQRGRAASSGCSVSKFSRDAQSLVWIALLALVVTIIGRRIFA